MMLHKKQHDQVEENEQLTFFEAHYMHSPIHLQQESQVEKAIIVFLMQVINALFYFHKKDHSEQHIRKLASFWLLQLSKQGVVPD